MADLGGFAVEKKGQAEWRGCCESVSRIFDTLAPRDRENVYKRVKRSASDRASAPIFAKKPPCQCLFALIQFCIKMFGICPDMHPNWNARSKTRLV